MFVLFTPWSSFGWWVFEVPIFLEKRNNRSVSVLDAMLFPYTMLSLHAMPLQMSGVSLDECGWKHSVHIFTGSSFVYTSHFPCDTLGACSFPILQESRLDAASPCLPITTVTITLGIICSKGKSWSSAEADSTQKRGNAQSILWTRMKISSCDYHMQRKKNLKGLESPAEALILMGCLL